jgi:hypothetical protein
MSASRSPGGTGARGREGVPLAPAALSGLAAFVLGYLITYIVKIGDVTEVLDSLVLDVSAIAPPADWQVIGWYFLAGHNVPIEATGTLGGSTTTTALDLEVAAWMLLLPAGLLLVAGFTVVRYAGIRALDRGALSGASVVVPYLVATILLAVLAGWTAGSGDSSSFQIGPGLVSSALIAGLGYPVVFGGVGGVLGAAVSS